MLGGSYPHQVDTLHLMVRIVFAYKMVNLSFEVYACLRKEWLPRALFGFHEMSQIFKDL